MFKVRFMGRGTAAALRRRDETPADDPARVLAMVESAPFNVLLCDRDLVVRYANTASQRALRALQPVLPAGVENLVGHSIETLHAFPEHQRRLLGDPSRLPHRTVVALGAEKLELLFTPIFAMDGGYAGPMITWSVVTEQLAQDETNLDNAGQIQAINATQAVIAFDMDGTILAANDNFLAAVGYSLDEIRGQHHSMFVDAKDRTSSEYRDFWAKLNRGEFHAGEFRRIGKGGKEVWIRASYNPILDASGKPKKVVKYAYDITEQRQRVNRILSCVRAAGQGDLTHDVGVSGDDSIGQVGEVLGTFFSDLRESIRTIAQCAQSLTQSSEMLTSVSQQMSINAAETSSQANLVSAAAEQVSHNVATVATGADEMGSSIREIASNASNAARVATTAVHVAADTNARISKLGESSAEIGKVIKVITSIAQQTNLLALNATIEAARAGEAGKGFAVVANEVKELAKATGQATEDIAQKIEAIQGDTLGAVEAIHEISSIINTINDIQTTIASAVEEQTATTNEIVRNVGEAARGSNEIAGNITGVAKAAESTTMGASDTQGAAIEVSRMAAELQSLIRRFSY